MTLDLDMWTHSKKMKGRAVGHGEQHRNSTGVGMAEVNGFHPEQKVQRRSKGGKVRNRLSVQVQK